jgi:hypothetical protein
MYFVLFFALSRSEKCTFLCRPMYFMGSTMFFLQHFEGSLYFHQSKLALFTPEILFSRYSCTAYPCSIRVFYSLLSLSHEQAYPKDHCRPEPTTDFLVFQREREKTVDEEREKYISNRFTHELIDNKTWQEQALFLLMRKKHQLLLLCFSII